MTEQAFLIRALVNRVIHVFLHCLIGIKDMNLTRQQSGKIDTGSALLQCNYILNYRATCRRPGLNNQPVCRMAGGDCKTTQLIVLCRRMYT